MIIKVIRNKNTLDQKIEYINDSSIQWFGEIISKNQIEELAKKNGKSIISYNAIEQLGEQVIKDEIRRIAQFNVDLVYKHSDGENRVIIIKNMNNPYKLTLEYGYIRVRREGLCIAEYDNKTHTMAAVATKFDNEWKAEILRKHNLIGYVFGYDEFENTLKEVGQNEKRVKAFTVNTKIKPTATSQ